MTDNAKCLFVQGCLVAFLSGHLAAWEQSQVKAHLRQCPTCQQAFLKVSARGIFQTQMNGRLNQTRLGSARKSSFRFDYDSRASRPNVLIENFMMTESILALNLGCRPAALEANFLRWVNAYQPEHRSQDGDVLTDLRVCVGNDYY